VGGGAAAAGALVKADQEGLGVVPGGAEGVVRLLSGWLGVESRASMCAAAAASLVNQPVKL